MFDEIIPKEERFFLRARTSFGVRVSVLVAHRVTEIYASSSCARFTPRDRSKVVQVNKEYVRSCVGLLNGMIKIKGTEESQKFSPLSLRQKKRLGLHFLTFFLLISFLRAVLVCRVLSHYYYCYYYYYYYCLCSIILSPLNRFRRS